MKEGFVMMVTLKNKRGLLAAVAAAKSLVENHLQKISFNANHEKH